MTGSFLQEPPLSPRVQALYDDDLAGDGYIWSLSRLWAHQPETLKRLFELMSQAFTPSGLTFRQRGILVTAAAPALGDSYCSLAWGGKLGTASDASRRSAMPGSMTGRSSPSPASWLSAWRSPRSTTPSVPRPDAQLARSVPQEVREAVTYGRPVAT